MIVSGTGHRPNKLGNYIIPNPIYSFVYSETIRILSDLQPSKVISGLALGFDTIIAKAANDLKIPWVGYRPFKDHHKAWPPQTQKEYWQLLKTAEELYTICEGDFAPYKMQIRNEALVNDCNILLGCHDGSNGGTYNCFQYAKKIGREIIIIDPKSYKP